MSRRGVAALAGCLLLAACGTADYHRKEAAHYRTRGMWAEAARAYGRLVAHEPGDAPGLEGLGDSQAALGRPDEALAAWEKALLVAPDSTDIMLKAGDLEAGRGRVDSAIAWYERPAGVDPNEWLGRTRAADLLIERGAFDRAAGLLSRILEANPVNVVALDRLGYVRAMQARHADAVGLLSRALSLRDSTPVRLNYGGSLLALGRLPEAQVELEKVVAAAPGNAEAHYLLASALARQGGAGQALIHLARAVELGLARPERLLSDADLAPLRETEVFRTLEETIRKKADMPRP